MPFFRQKRPFWPKNVKNRQNREKSSKIAFFGILPPFWRFRACPAKTFKKDPTKYEPQYGGWCAYAMGAKGEKVEINPETFKIVDGKLYLFYNRFFSNTLTDWNKDEAHLKKQADVNWQKTFK